MKNARYIVPNFFTSLNFLLGAWAILLVTGAIEFLSITQIPAVLASHLVVYCVLMDKLDGFAASLMNAKSEFGAQFDSLADLIAFGVAPAICLLKAYQELTPQWYADNQLLLLVCISAYMLCAAMRLARYNAVDADANPDFFLGLPSTLAGGFNVVFLIIAIEYDFFRADNPLLPALAIFMLLSSVMMLTTLYLPKFKSRENKILNIIQFFGILTGYALGFAMILTEILLALISTYAIFGFGYGFVVRLSENDNDDSDSELDGVAR